MKKLALTILLCAVSYYASIAQDKPEIFVQLGHSDDISTVAFSPDGNYVLSGSKNVKLWDIKSGREVRTFSTNNSRVAFSPDGKYALSASSDNTLKLWDIKSGKEIRTFSGHKFGVNSVTFSPDGNYALSGGGDDALKLWDIKSGKEVRTFLGQTNFGQSVAFSPDGNYAISGSREILKLWDIKTGNEIRTFLGHTESISSVAFSPNGNYALSGSWDITLKFWDIKNGKEIRTFSGYTGGASVVFSPDGNYVLSGSSGNTLKLWNIKNGSEVRIFSGHTNTVRSFAFSPDGKNILSGSDDYTLKLWDVKTGKEIRTFSGHTIPVNSVAISRAGNFVICASNNKTLILWDINSGKEVRTFSPSYYPVAFSPNGNYVLSGSENNTLTLWDINSGKKVNDFSGNKEIVNTVAFSNDGNYVLSGGGYPPGVYSVSGDYSLKLWDIKSGKEIKTFLGHTNSVTSVAFSPNGNYVLSGSSDMTLKLWNIKNGKEIKTFSKYGWMGGVTSIAFSPDGNYILSGSDVNNIWLWDINSGKDLRMFSGHSHRINAVAFSPDGNYALSSSDDDTIKLWDINSGREVKIFLGHANGVTSVAFSSDGNYAFSGSRDGTMRKWKISDGKEIAQFISFPNSEWVVMTPEGYFNCSPKGAEHINVRQGNNVYAIDQFFDTYFNPEYVSSALNGKAIETKKDIRKGFTLPPIVKITNPKNGDAVKNNTVTIDVEVTDQGGGIDEVRLFHNGSNIAEEQRGMKKIKKAGEKIVKHYTITLLPGENTFKATAFNTERTESNPDEITVTLQAAQAEAMLYVFAIGINEYKNQQYKLNYCRADADAFATEVEKKGKNIFKQSKKIVVFDGDATKQNILSTINTLSSTIQSQDVFVFYYSGHGVMSEGNETQPSDFYFVLNDVTQMYGRDDMLREKGISAQEMRTLCGKVKALKKLIVIDACQSGKAVETFAFAKGAAEEKAIWQLQRSTGIGVLASTGNEQFATEFSQLGHGVYTYALLQGLKCENIDSKKDGRVTVYGLANYLDDQVPELTQKYRGTQQLPKNFLPQNDFPLGICK
jgi:WD40 repeat protein